MEQILKSEIIVQLYQSKEIGEFIDGFKKVVFPFGKGQP